MKIKDINNKQYFSFPCIYLWTNLINNKVYVGQTQNFYNRMQQYSRGNDSNRIIGQALHKYGIDNFDIAILEKVEDVEKLDECEQYWMEYYKSYDLSKGYNLCKEAGTTRGYHHTEEDKKKMSEIVKRRLQNHPEYIKFGKDNPMFGKHPTEETRDKMSKSRIGNKNAKGKTWKLSPEQAENRRKNMLGRKNSLGRKLSKEARDKISESNRHRKISEETKRKISEGNKGKTAKKVKCVETNMIFNSIGEAAKFVGRDSSGIGKCAKGTMKTCGGFHWEFVDVDE